MSQYGEIYRSEFKSFQGDIIRIDISPTDNLIDDADTPTIVNMQPSGSPLVISTVDNSEDKLTPIRGKQAEIRVKTDSLINMGLFSAGPDNLWYVKITNQTAADTIFLGYLVLDDIGQPFLSNPQELTLIASDHLGILKDVALTNFDDKYPVGYFRIADFIAWALDKTGLQLPIRVINNLRVGLGSFSFSAQFSADLKRIALPAAAATYFYPGMQFTTSSTNNPGPFTVAAVAGGIITLVQLNESVVDEGPVTLTFSDSNTQKHLYDSVSLWAQSFEKEINEAEDCYSVLKKILGEDCTIFQYKGEWWIVRVDEYEGNPFYVSTFNADGSFASFDGTIDLDKNIGPLEANRWVNADAFLRTTRPLGFAQETYKYEYPQEVICNIDFSRGDVIDASNPYSIIYQVECWDFAEHKANGNSPISGVGSAVIIRNFNPPGYEIERFTKINNGSGVHPRASIKSNQVYINQKDIVNISVDFKLNADIADTLLNPVAIELVGDDGSYWYLSNPDADRPDKGQWFQYSPSATDLITFNFSSESQDETEWMSASIGSDPAPVSGKLYIYLMQGSGSASITDIYYQNLSFELQPLVNGSYQKYIGQQLKVNTPNPGYLAKRDEDVYISDAPSRLFKGALLLDRTDTVVLVNKFYASAPFALSNPPSPDYVHPYGYIQAYSVWNQGRLGLSKLSGNILYAAGDWPDAIHRYILTDPNDSTNNRYFVVLSMQQDWKSCIMNLTICEVFNTVSGKVYSDPFTFKYTTT